jgi:hypothetical protein
MARFLKAVFPLCVLLLGLHRANSAAVGYTVVTFYSGKNYFADQFFYGDNSLNTFFTGASGATIPDGTQFSKWDSATSAFLPFSVYNLSLDSWSINYTLNPGEGAELITVSPFTNTFVGAVANYTNLVSGLPGPGENWDPNYENGLHLISAPVPVQGAISNLFYYAVGRNPLDGESVLVLDPRTQSTATATYNALSGSWINGDLFISVGESAFFNLGPVPVPEPGALSLLTFGALCALWEMRRKRLNRSRSPSGPGRGV